MNRQVNTLQTLLFCPIYRKGSQNLREWMVNWGHLVWGASSCSCDFLSCAFPLRHPDSVWSALHDCPQRRQFLGPQGHSCSLEEGVLKTRFSSNGWCFPRDLRGEASPSLPDEADMLFWIVSKRTEVLHLRTSGVSGLPRGIPEGDLGQSLFFSPGWRYYV